MLSIKQYKIIGTISCGIVSYRMNNKGCDNGDKRDKVHLFYNEWVWLNPLG